MTKVDQLIGAVDQGDPQADDAVEKLLSLGMPVIEPVVQAVRTSIESSAWKLSTVIRRMSHPDMVPVFVRLMNDENSTLAIAALKGIASLRDIRTVEPLHAYITTTVFHPTRVSLAIKALGEIRQSDSVRLLREFVNNMVLELDISSVLSGEKSLDSIEVEESSLLMLIDAIVALAKFGIHESFPIIVALSRYSSSDPYSEDEVIRTNAIAAIRYTVGRGAIAALREALHDEYDEVRMMALEAIFYLGTQEAIAEIVKSTKDNNPLISENAVVRLSDLSGEDPSVFEKAEKIPGWWKQRASDYKPGICYRLGKPMDVSNIMVVLAEPHRRQEILDEIRIITGESFGFDPEVSVEKQGSVVEAARTWWEREGSGFEKGVLYKYGHKQDVGGLN